MRPQFLLVEVSKPYLTAGHDKFGVGMRLIWKLIIKPNLSQATYVSTVHVSWF